jgi:hypothetical protein
MFFVVLRLSAACGIVMPIPLGHLGSMRLLSSIVRTLRTCCGVALLWSVSVSPAAGAPASAQQFSACKARPTTILKLGRHARSFGGPLKRPAPLQFGLTDPTARVRPAIRTDFDTDDAAIQNDAPAAHLDEDGRPVPSLLFAGVLPHAADIRPRSPTFTPRAPRGPPPAA